MHAQGSAIVVGVDEEGQSSAALLWAAAEARRRDAVLRIVHAWQSPQPGRLPRQRQPHQPGRGQPRRAEQHQQRAEQPAPRLAPREVIADQEDVFDRVTAILETVAPDLVVTVEPMEGAPGPVLVDAASEADLLVVGTAGADGRDPVRFGPVSRHCVAHAPCQVVVVREPQETIP